MGVHKVRGWMADRAGCGQYRIAYPFTQLRRLGWEADYSLRLDRHNKAGYELIVGQRLGHPSTVEILKLMQHAGAKIIVEHDDDLFNVPPRNPAAKIFINPAVRKGMADCIRVADAVTVSTPHLADRLRELNPNVYVLPNSVPKAVLDVPDPTFSNGDGTDPAEPVLLGWRGSPTHEEDFAEAVHGLGRVLRNPNAFLHIIGSAPSNRLPDGKVHHTGWIKDLAVFYSALQFDIGIVPLADNVFNQSKSHIAALEMAARGIPVVASDGPAYRDFVEHGVTGFLVKQRHEWARYINQLVRDPALRQQMGKEAKSRALAYTTEVVAETYDDVYRGVLAA